MSFSSFPFRIDGTGRTTTVGEEEHLRQLIEQLVLTIPGERVNRPTFGSAIQNLVFGANNAELEAAVQFVIQSAVQRWLGDQLEVEGVQAIGDDATLRVTVQYVIRRTRQRRVLEVERRLSL